MATAEQISRAALNAVRVLNKPAWNWPGVNNSDELAKNLTGHKINAAHKVNLISFAEKVDHTLKLKISWGAPYHPTFAAPDRKRSLQRADYFIQHAAQVQALNCGERTSIAMHFAWDHRADVGAAFVNAGNHDFLLIYDQLGEAWMSQKTGNRLNCTAAALEAPPGAWICDPWYWDPATMREYSEAGVSYAAGNWALWGPIILTQASVQPPYLAQILGGFPRGAQ